MILQLHHHFCRGFIASDLCPKHCRIGHQARCGANTCWCTLTAFGQIHNNLAASMCPPGYFFQACFQDFTLPRIGCVATQARFAHLEAGIQVLHRASFLTSPTASLKRTSRHPRLLDLAGDYCGIHNTLELPCTVGGNQLRLVVFSRYLRGFKHPRTQVVQDINIMVEHIWAIHGNSL